MLVCAATHSCVSQVHQRDALHSVRLSHLYGSAWLHQSIPDLVGGPLRIATVNRIGLCCEDVVSASCRHARYLDGRREASAVA